ncbi:hypothetical protein D3C85_412710 [compost metagenome]
MLGRVLKPWAMPGPITTDPAWAASAAAQGAEGRAISNRRVSGTHSMAASGRTAPRGLGGL